MRTYITLPNKPAKEVKNLGWLLRNWSKVESFRFYYSKAETGDGILSAQLKGGGFFRTEFASLTVCFGFLRRPVFDSLTLKICVGSLADATAGKPQGSVLWVIGSESYLAILREYRAPAQMVRGQYDNAGQHRKTLARILGVNF